MIKNTRNNRLMGSIDRPSDVSYRLFVRDFIEDIEFSRPNDFDTGFNTDLHTIAEEIMDAHDPNYKQ
jgi:hypothetical protein